MAATPKGPQKAKLEVNIDKQVYDDFIRNCAKKGFAANTVAERLLRKFNETGQF